MSKTFEEWRRDVDPQSFAESILAGQAWHARDAEIDLMQSEPNLADALLASMQAKIEDLYSRIEALTEALSNLLSAHHHSRGDEWVDAAYLALAPADEMKRE